MRRNFIRELQRLFRSPDDSWKPVDVKRFKLDCVRKDDPNAGVYRLEMIQCRRDPPPENTRHSGDLWKPDSVSKRLDEYCDGNPGDASVSDDVDNEQLEQYVSRQHLSGLAAALAARREPILYANEIRIDESVTTRLTDGLVRPMCSDLDAILGQRVITGVNTWYFFATRENSIAPMHVENFSMFSLNYMLPNRATKMWIGFHLKYMERVNKIIADLGEPNKENGTTDLKWCANFLQHQAFVFDTSFFEQHRIPYFIEHQHETEAIITLPGGFHQTVSIGVSYSEAINFTIRHRWVKFAQQTFQCKKWCTYDPTESDSGYTPIRVVLFGREQYYAVRREHAVAMYPNVRLSDGLALAHREHLEEERPTQTQQSLRPGSRKISLGAILHRVLKGVESGDEATELYTTAGASAKRPRSDEVPATQQQPPVVVAEAELTQQPQMPPPSEAVAAVEQEDVQQSQETPLVEPIQQPQAVAAVDQEDVQQSQETPLVEPIQQPLAVAAADQEDVQQSQATPAVEPIQQPHAYPRHESTQLVPSAQLRQPSRRVSIEEVLSAVATQDSKNAEAQAALKREKRRKYKAKADKEHGDRLKQAVINSKAAQPMPSQSNASTQQSPSSSTQSSVQRGAHQDPMLENLTNSIRDTNTAVEKKPQRIRGLEHLLLGEPPKWARDQGPSRVQKWTTGQQDRLKQLQGELADAKKKYTDLENSRIVYRAIRSYYEERHKTSRLFEELAYDGYSDPREVVAHYWFSESDEVLNALFIKCVTYSAKEFENNPEKLRLWVEAFDTVDAFNHVFAAKCGCKRCGLGSARTASSK